MDHNYVCKQELVLHMKQARYDTTPEEKTQMQSCARSRPLYQVWFSLATASSRIASASKGTSIWIPCPSIYVQSYMQYKYDINFFVVLCTKRINAQQATGVSATFLAAYWTASVIPFTRCRSCMLDLHRPRPYFNALARQLTVPDDLYGMQ